MRRHLLFISVPMLYGYELWFNDKKNHQTKLIKRRIEYSLFSNQFEFKFKFKVVVYSSRSLNQQLWLRIRAWYVRVVWIHHTVQSLSFVNHIINIKFTMKTHEVFFFYIYQMERIPGDANNFLPFRNSPSRDLDRFIGESPFWSLSVPHTHRHTYISCR